MRRKAGAILRGVFGLWLLASGIAPWLDGLSTGHAEFMNNLVIFAVIAVLCIGFGLVLLRGAIRRWSE